MSVFTIFQCFLFHPLQCLNLNTVALNVRPLRASFFNIQLGIKLFEFHVLLKSLLFQQLIQLLSIWVLRKP